jgi:ABC-type glutathione transport system ATPase component
MFQTTKGDGLANVPQPNHELRDESPAFELTELSKIYNRGKGTPVRAVDDLSLSVPTGQVVGCLDPTVLARPPPSK